MNRLKVYVAGPITKGDLAHNVNQATAAFVTLAKAGLAPFCPHWSVYSKPCIQTGTPADPESMTLCCGTVSGNDQMTHADWLGIDLAWVTASDALLRLPGESKGADLEEFEAVKWGVPVFRSVDEVIEWASRR